MALAEVQVKKIISDLNGLLGSQQFLSVVNERTCFASCGCVFKYPGWSLIWNALLTKELPIFLLHLNEINGDCKKILPVLASFWSNLKCFRMKDFPMWLWGWMELYYYSPETFVVLIDFLKSPSSCLFSTRRTKDFSYLIGANFSDPKTGRCALTNQRSRGYPLGTDLSNYAQRNVTCG